MVVRLSALIYKIVILSINLVFFLALSLSVISQKIEFRGKVVDFDTKTPIPGITISIPSIKKATITDQKGLFTFLLETDDYTFHFSSVEYRNISEIVSIPFQKSITVELKKKLP